MSTYDILGRLALSASGGQTETVRREDTAIVFTEKTELTYVVAGATSDLSLALGGVANCDTLWLESLTANEEWSFKLNGSGETAITMAGQGFVIIKGATLTSIHVSVAGANPVTLKLVALD